MRNHTFWIGPALAIVVGLLTLQAGLGEPAAWTAGVAVLCMIWWIFNPVPIPVASLMPLAILPLVGAMPMRDVSIAYGSPLILLLLGGFILSSALAHNHAHERLAILMVRLFGGTSGRRLVLGFMVAAAALSMWISNTATTLMLVPVAMAVLERNKSNQQLAPPLLMGIAFAANVGGIGTPIGTPPNLVFMQVYTSAGYPEISFLQWMQWAVPLVLVFVPIIWLWLTRNIGHLQAAAMPDSQPWSAAERRVMIIFAITAIAWMTRKAPLGGWSTLLDLPAAHDSHVALLAAVLMFIVPNGKGGRLLNWEVVEKIPWGVFLLFAGGVCLASAFQSTGISDALGGQFKEVTVLPVIVMVMIIALSVTFITEMTSNLATTSLAMPILLAAAIATDLDPLLLMIPAVMSASCAFMLPVATAPNTVVYSTGRFTVGDLVREGVVLNGLGAILITLTTILLFT